jgi:hypothetical protein
MRYREKLAALNNALAAKKQEYAHAILVSNAENTVFDGNSFVRDMYVLEGRIQQIKELILEDFENESFNEAIDRLSMEMPEIMES